ncbi:YheC/YheD family protein [Paenibacillus chartarius]|uniref:YheC/YheD family protein n=1 Tax=Paenibacillus chartarius TaxID=747481 RepID=A0ABV6DR60_9BACL
MKKERKLGKVYHDKWGKTQMMCSHKRLALYVPETRRLSAVSLREMLQRYGMVYVKPCFGSLGRGVMKVERLQDAKKIRYAYQLGEKRFVFNSFRELTASLRKVIRGESYLVQQGIHVLKRAGRPFDIRLMVQLNERGRWEVTGVIGRVAHPRKIVTNGSQGGTIYTVDQLLKGSAPSWKQSKAVTKMNRVGMVASKVLKRSLPKLWEVGLDLAVDGELKPWILEANTRPDPCPFTKIADRSMLQRIVRLGRLHGRVYDLRCTKARRGR